jgi:hypothetical protein
MKQAAFLLLTSSIFALMGVLHALRLFYGWKVARELRLTKQTVGNWHSRFLAAPLGGLLDEPRPGPRGRSATGRSITW